MTNDKIMLAIMSGGDWTDASVEHLVISKSVDLDNEMALYKSWYYEEYCKRFEEGRQVEYITFSQWLKRKGAKEPPKNMLIEYWED